MNVPESKQDDLPVHKKPSIWTAIQWQLFWANLIVGCVIASVPTFITQYLGLSGIQSELAHSEIDRDAHRRNAETERSLRLAAERDRSDLERDNIVLRNRLEQALYGEHVTNLVTKSELSESQWKQTDLATGTDYRMVVSNGHWLIYGNPK